jgi:hypothetical protein
MRGDRAHQGRDRRDGSSRDRAPAHRARDARHPRHALTRMILSGAAARQVVDSDTYASEGAAQDRRRRPRGVPRPRRRARTDRPLPRRVVVKGLADLDELVGRPRTRGMQVDYEVDGPPRRCRSSSTDPRTASFRNR